jgi:hypothetical protein
VISHLIHNDHQGHRHHRQVCLPSFSCPEGRGKTNMCSVSVLPSEPLPPPYLLREVQVAILNTTRCRDLFRIPSPLSVINNDTICAGSEDGSVDTCSVSVPIPPGSPPSNSGPVSSLYVPPQPTLGLIHEKSVAVLNYPVHKTDFSFSINGASSTIPAAPGGGDSGPTLQIRKLSWVPQGFTPGSPVPHLPLLLWTPLSPPAPPQAELIHTTPQGDSGGPLIYDRIDYTIRLDS